MNDFTIADNGLMIAFHRPDGADRWQLSLGLSAPESANASWVPLLRSVVASADETWPAFPPLQELLPGEHAGRPSAQLVGMAGKHHWSLSVAWQPNLSQWLFDFACRCESPPGPGQTAFTIASKSLIEVHPRAAVLQSAESQRSLTIAADGLPEVATAISHTTPGDQSALPELKITGAPPNPTPGRQTLRWYFGVRAA